MTAKERSGYQEHFADLCRLIRHPVEADPTGERFIYEARAAKAEGGKGWATGGASHL